MQCEFTAMQDAIHDLTDLKQEFEQIILFKINTKVHNLNGVILNRSK